MVHDDDDGGGGDYEILVELLYLVKSVCSCRWCRGEERKRKEDGGEGKNREGRKGKI